MDFLDNATVKAKEIFDVARKKTNETVGIQKQKFNIGSLENKRSKDFEVLGEIFYNKIKNGDVVDADVSEIVSSIDEKNDKIKQLKEEINTVKNKKICPKCGLAIDVNSNYCSACGEKFIFDSSED